MMQYIIEVVLEVWKDTEIVRRETASFLIKENEVIQIE